MSRPPAHDNLPACPKCAARTVGLIETGALFCFACDHEFMGTAEEREQTRRAEAAYHRKMLREEKAAKAETELRRRIQAHADWIKKGCLR